MALMRCLLHIDGAGRFASEAGITNVSFHAADFDAAAGFDFPGFDYIVSHGVYTWVNQSTRQSWAHESPTLTIPVAMGTPSTTKRR
jgi:hypothetical protein